MYADDTYIIVLACNIQSREAELDHVAKWAHATNPFLTISRHLYNDTFLF